ncbi:MAG TPA: ATP-binding cassette domain-containing protein [Anaerolineae bacterium]|nr:ATP-binding cassette domain-containing protein [Anaerolineae bacterium]HQH37384.1 ATP-binding cassette domain-containing protein [Anaerolineae bacterium]
MIDFEHVTYTYPDAMRPALRDVTLSIPDGALALVIGNSGAGKSTLLRCLNGLVPHFSGGTLSGRVTVDGLEPVAAGPQVMSRTVGFVFQDPEAQFVMDRVEDEVAFALENAAIPPEDMRARVTATLELLHLTSLRQRKLDTLSGGEKQRVALASALALHPRILALDEPTSQLDPQSAAELLDALVRLNKTLELTIVLAEHRLERVLPGVDQVIYLPDDDAAVMAGPPREVLLHVPLLPPLQTLARALGWLPLPLTLEEGVAFSRQLSTSSFQPSAVSHQQETGEAVETVVETRGLEVAYGPTTVLRGVDMALYRGEIVALVGRNGVGKTTLLRSLVGLLRPRQGDVWVEGRSIAAADVAAVCRRVGYLPQDPNALLFADTVLDELYITLHNHGIPLDHAPIAPEMLLEQLGLADKAQRYPRDLSVGERQRVALGAIMVTRPGALLLDEPTRGLDYRAKAQLRELLCAWRTEGLAILLVTHDVELVAAVADRVLVMDEGRIVAQGHPPAVLRASPTFTPQIARLFPTTGWITVEEALAGITSP